MLIFLCISPGIMLVIYQKTNCSVPLRILSIEDGTPLKTFSQLLHRNRKVDFIEQFNEKLLVKQDKENLQIVDVSHYYSLPPTISLPMEAAVCILFINWLDSLGRLETPIWSRSTKQSSWPRQLSSSSTKTIYSWHFAIGQLRHGTFVES